MAKDHHIVGSVLDWAGKGFECNDLSTPSSWNRLLPLLPLASHVGIDLLCNTWTKARRAPLWSSYPHRSRGAGDEVFGLQGLSKSDHNKALSGNHMFFGSLKVVQKCLKLNIPGYRENPKNSWLWETPQIINLLNARSQP